MEQTSLFAPEPLDNVPAFDPNAPLAARMRPRTFDELVGQEHVAAAGAGLRRAVESGRLGSIILWGPPGCGKTTLAEIIANTANANFRRISAVSAGVSEMRKAIDEARSLRKKGSTQRTILFIDEIHRFNKAQQDAILAAVEDGTITLIGATTENPSFEVNAALLSRSRVYTLRALSDDDIIMIVQRALSDHERGLGSVTARLTDEAEQAIARFSNGDARSALNILETAVSLWEAGAHDGDTDEISVPQIEAAAQRKALLYDKGGEQHYDIISALHKSVRGSDPDATLYWLARMLEAGEDRLFVARRLIRMASEDIGLADPTALALCIAAQQATHFLGIPEGDLALAQAAVYLAVTPKSNAVYKAFGAAQQAVTTTRNDPVPLHLRNAPTSLMKSSGYGEGYKYAHDYDDALVYQQNLPDAIKDATFYHPTERGIEKRIAERLAGWQQTWTAQRETQAEA